MSRQFEAGSNENSKCDRDLIKTSCALDLNENEWQRVDVSGLRVERWASDEVESESFFSSTRLTQNFGQKTVDLTRVDPHEVSIFGSSFCSLKLKITTASVNFFRACSII